MKPSWFVLPQAISKDANPRLQPLPRNDGWDMPNCDGRGNGIMGGVGELPPAAAWSQKLDFPLSRKPKRKSTTPTLCMYNFFL